MPSLPRFETARLRFRRFTPEDAPLLIALDSDPAVMKYLTRGRPTPPEEIREVILPQVLAQSAAHPNRGIWAVHERATEAFIGWFHYKPDRYAADEMELGYRLMRRAWGQGYATEGGRYFVRMGFAEWGDAKISARALEGHAASRRVMEKCGLRFEHNFVIPEEELPDWSEAERRAVKYGRHRADWLADAHAG